MASQALQRRLDVIEPLAKASAGKLEKSVYGVVDRVDKVDGQLIPHYLRRWKGTIGNMVQTDEEPTIHLIEKLEPFILKHKKVKAAYGGRAGTKSMASMDIMIGEVNATGCGVFCLRERMKSLDQSIYKGVNSRIRDLKLKGFIPIRSRWAVEHRTGGMFQFGGLLNVADMKSAFDFKYFLLEEAERTSQKALDILGPTLRGVNGAEQWMIWNQGSSSDPMSQEFIVPYKDSLDRRGYYEDDYHYIVKVGFQDNPWFKYDESLTEEHDKDQKKVKAGMMKPARYNHIWMDAFNDDIDTSVITQDWFDACVDAHKKLGFGVDYNGNTAPTGAKKAALDPADVGKDKNGYAECQGVIIMGLDEIEAENANRAFDIAARRAMNYGAESFGWDGDGLGAILRDQAERSFKNSNTNVFMYKGSTEVHHPEAMYRSENTSINMKTERKNKDVFKNKKAQNITAFADRVFRTYEAVVHKVYHDPDTLISFNSETIPADIMQKFRAEACKLPLKPGDKIQYYTKDELRKGIMMPDGQRVVIPSPNLFDAANILFDKDATVYGNQSAYIPQPYKTLGTR